MLFAGYVFTAPDSILNTHPGMFHLEECVDQCAKETKCLAVNYETGLCVLFSASADFNPGKIIRLRKRNSQRAHIYNLTTISC